MTYTTQIDIKAPIEQVAALLANRNAIPLWVKDVKAYKHLSGEPATAGAKAAISINLGAAIEITETILAVEYPNRFAVRFDMPQGTLLTNSMLQSTGANTTRYTLEHTFTFNGMLKLGAALMKPTFIKHSQKIMDGFKQLAENSPT